MRRYFRADTAFAKPDVYECLERLEGNANVVTAPPAAHRTPVHDDAGWFCGLDGKIDGIRE